MSEPGILNYFVAALAAYLLGSIPFGFLVAKAKRIDIRAVGSGNIGATNAMRVLGKPAGICVLLLDALKGFAACFFGKLIASFFTSRMGGYDIYEKPHDLHIQFFLFFHNQSEIIEYTPIIAGIFAVLGHNYTCWLKFKGGKGVATSAGVYLALAPWPLFIATLIFILAVVLTRYVSVGSIVAAIALPAAVWVWPTWPQQNIFLDIVTTALGALAIYKHKSNIQRLMAGTENRLGKKSSTPEKTK